MKYSPAIADMQVGDVLQGFCILKKADVRASASGRNYLTAVLSDASGEMDAVFWDWRPGDADERDAGKIVMVTGRVSEYRNSPQVVIDSIRLRTEADRVDMAALVPAAPIDVEQTFREVCDLVNSMEDSDYADVCREMLRRHGEQFRIIPAAKRIHHSFRSGLLMHTASMMKAADSLARLYPGTVDRSLLLAGTLLHDFAKERDFVLSPLGLVTGYTAEGDLLGHLVTGAQEVGEVCRELGTPREKAMLLQHLILSHHGEPEYGAAVVPCTAEAELLHYIDMIDSRMEIYRENLEQMHPGEMSGRNFALDHRIYCHS